jgi:hypothetical protein
MMQFIVTNFVYLEETRRVQEYNVLWNGQAPACYLS